MRAVIARDLAREFVILLLYGAVASEAREIDGKDPCQVTYTLRLNVGNLVYAVNGFNPVRDSYSVLPISQA